MLSIRITSHMANERRTISVVLFVGKCKNIFVQGSRIM